MNRMFIPVKHKKLFPFFLLFLTCLLTGQVSAQGGKTKTVYEPADAEEHFRHNNFIMALRVYKELYKKDKTNIDFNWKIGICYLETNINKKEAVPYLEFVCKQPKVEPEAFYDLGRAYHYANRFDDAIRMFNKYKEKGGSKMAEKADREIEMCNNGKELVKFPVKVTFENLKELNSEYPDYYPFTTANESFVVFTSRRKGNVGASTLEVDGYYSSDIYMSTVKGGVFAKPKNLGSPVNGNFDEQCVGLAPDGSSMTVYIDNITDVGNIYTSKFDKNGFTRPVKCADVINEGFETAGSLSPDGNTFYFASDRAGSKGQTDIFMVRKLPNGNWALPQPISMINTKYREDFPFMASDGKTLYFASEGHSSMGGFDIFKTVYNEETGAWSAPKNLGYPINDSQDNRSISFTADNHFGYISALREGGMGDLDIYRITFDDISRYTVVTGKVQYTDSLSKKSINAIITITNTKTLQQVGTYTPVANTGKYVMALAPGKYDLSVDSPGCKPINTSLTILDLGSFQPEITLNLTLIEK
jgi:hypothetical protein